MIEKRFTPLEIEFLTGLTEMAGLKPVLSNGVYNEMEIVFSFVCL